MSVVAVYGKLYADCVKKAFRGLGKNAWVLLLVPALSAAFFAAALLLSPLGIIGGFVLVFFRAALVSAYLYFLGETVAESKAGLHELKAAMGRYFWAIISVGFVVWIASFVLTPLIGNHPKGGLIQLALYFVAFILFNATPEAIYQSGRMTGLATFGKSLEFIQANWIEWFIPNLIIAAVCGFLFILLSGVLLAAGLPSLISAVVFGALLHVVMVFRGHLYQALDGSSHRQRMFRFRNG